MLLRDLFEARKNPEQNPKTSINQEIDNYAAEHGRSFVSFTTVDKLGINPKSGYKTPLGIYAYPIGYVQRETEGGRSMRSLPFAGRSPFANLFQASGNIIRLDKISPAEARGYYKKLSQLWANQSGVDWKTSVDQIEDIILDAPDNVSSQLWYVFKHVAILISGDSSSMRFISAWNKLFRSVGIDGCVDPGIGIIHSNEPAQAVFFSIDSIKNVKRVYNKWSPEAIDDKLEVGSMQLAIANDIASRVNGKTVDEVIQMFNFAEIAPNGINYIKSPGMRYQLLQAAPNLFVYVQRPTKREYRAALVRDPSVLHKMNSKRLFPDVLVDLLKTQDPAFTTKLIESITKSVVIRPKRIIPDEVINAVVDIDPFALEVWDKVGVNVPVRAVKIALEKLKGTKLPDWLIILAHKLKLN